MTRDQDRPAGAAAALRLAFDQTFSEPPAAAREDMESLLVLRDGGEAYAVRLAEISGLVADRTTVHLPSSVPEFLGVAGLRHDVVPVYSLCRLLRPGTAGGTPRWLIVARAAQPVAFAFEHFDGHRRVPPSALLASRDGAGSPHGPATVRFPDGLCGVVSIGSLLKTIEDRVRRIGTIKEQ